MSILDIGVGFGKYGVLAREYLELWEGKGKYGDWTRRIDGIEAHGDYITPLHRYIYTNLYVGKAQAIVTSLDCKYDLIIMIDVIEHLDVSEAKDLISECVRRGKNLLVSTPKKPEPQRALFENDYETHRSQWTPEMLAGRNSSFVVPDRISWIIVIGEDAARMRRWYWYERVASRSPALANACLALYRVAKTFKK